MLGSIDPRLPHAVPLQQLLRHGRPLPRGARRPRDLHASRTAASPTEVRRYPISIEWPPAPLAMRSRRSPSAARGCASELGLARRRAARRRRRPARLHQGHPRALPGGRAAARARAALDRAVLVRAGRGAVALVDRRIPERSTRAVRALAERINARFARGRLPPIILHDRAPRRRRRSTSYYRAADAVLRLAACTTA